jgi:tetratricopeptide (TPR) repeat protein
MFLRLGYIFLLPVFAFSLNAQTPPQTEFKSLLKKGVTLSQQADYPGAIPVLEQARKLAPRHYLANLLLGIDLLRSGRPADAIDPLHVATEVNPNDASAVGYLGEAQTALGDFAGAAESFQAGVSRAPHSEETLLGWADFGLERFRALSTWLRSTEKGTAVVLRVEAEGMEDGTKVRENLLRQSAAKSSEQSGIWGELGVAQAQLGMRSDAEESLKIALERQPAASATWQLEALMEAAAGNWPDAEARLRAVGERSPAALRRSLAAWPRSLLPDHYEDGSVWQCVRERSTNCVAAIASPKADVGESAEQLFAEERWEQSAAVPPPAMDQTAMWFRRGVALGEIGDCAQAIPALERGLKDGAEAAAFWLTICYGAQAEGAAAQLRSQGKEAAIHQLRGDMLLRMKGDAAAAAAEYAAAHRLRPKDADLSERMAQAYLALGDMDRARQAANDALAADPHRLLALRLVALVAMSERDYFGALVFLKKMIAMDPTNAWARVQMGTAYAQSGRPEQAVRYLQLTLAAGYPDEKGALHAVLAGALRKLGREQEAKTAAAEASRLADSFQARGQKSPNDHQ